VLGGERNTLGGVDTLNLAEKLFLPVDQSYFPVVRQLNTTGEPDDTFALARGIPLNQWIGHAFYFTYDYIDTFFFDVPTGRSVTVLLRDIPLGSNYDISLYTSNKLWLGTSENVGDLDESLTETVGPGRYFIQVVRVFPPLGSPPDTRPYQVMVQG
jgi:hypothetical protein